MSISSSAKITTDATASQVRRAIAAGLHELSPLLQDKAAQYIREPFLALVQDQDVEVRTALMAHLPQLLETLSAQLKGDERKTFMSECLKG